jgi:hypothetical protein
LPTYTRLPRFEHDYQALTADEKQRFKAALQKFVTDLKRGRGFRPGLRVKGVRGAKGVFELTWAGDGRATFSYGASVRPGEPHVIWRRVGGHEILGDSQGRQ